MAGRASLGDKFDRRHMQCGTGAKLIFTIGLLIIFRGTGMAEEHRNQCQRTSKNPCPPRGRITLVLGIEEMPDHRTNHNNQRQNHPGIGCRKNGWIMPADHHEYHRQCQIVVMQGPLLAPRTVTRIRFITGDQCCHHLLLAGDDHHGHIRHHDGPNGNADLHEGTTRRKHLGKGPRQRDNEHKPSQCQYIVVPAQRAATQRIIDHPTANNTGNADGNGLPRLKIEYFGIDHIKSRLRVIDDGKQCKARQEGGISFPFEPCQFVRHARWRHQIFHHIVEPAPMHLPDLTMRLFGQCLAGLQAQIQRDEVEGRANPGNSSNDM